MNQPVPLPAGVHTNIEFDVYLSDPCTRPSLNASTAKTLCDRSPMHARHAHPRLNPSHERDTSPYFDIGTAAHAILLEGHDVCAPVDADDWRTKHAREQRDTIRESGRIPLLRDQWERVNEMAATVQLGLAELDIDPPLLTDGKPEVTVVWDEPGDVTCRARLDWLRDDRTAFTDVKTTSRGAHPVAWAQRRLWDFGVDVQAAFYQRGLRALTGVDAQPRVLVIESDPPYAFSVLGFAPAALDLAHEKVEWAVRTWRTCMNTGSWPGYTARVAYAEVPSWQSVKWAEERYIEEEGAA